MRRLAAAFVSLACCATSMYAQDKAWKKSLEAGLESSYRMSKSSKLEINNVTEPGTVFVIQKDGLAADLAHDVVTFTTRVINGEVSQRGGTAGFFSKSTTKRLQPGDRVYVMGIDVKDDRIRVNMLTLELASVQVKGSTKQTRYRGSVDFEFDTATLASMDLETARKTIEAVLIPADKAAASATKTIELGQTIEQVEGILGKPATVVKLGEKTIYTYKDMKVVFLNGKVSDVQ
jgi:hypothetical protein